jgi:quercetin dioxygenase-like cupin family protein
VTLRIDDGETITALERREVVILAARPEATVTWTRYAGGEPGPGLHVHREHTDAFYVLDGELTFAVGPGAERVTAGPGAFVAVPPNTVHTFSNDSGAEASWLNFHAPDTGFASYLRSGAAWDSFDAPADGGLPAGGVMVSGPGERERVVPGLRIVEWEEEPGAAPEHTGARWTFSHPRGVLEIRAPD